MTRPSDEQLRDAYQRAGVSPARAGRARCPGAEALAALVDRKGAEEARLAVLDHVMMCADCRRELDFMRAAAAAAAAAVPVRSWWHSPSSRLMALAAMLLVAAGISVYNSRGADPEEGSRLRGGDAVGVLPVRRLAAGDLLLSWRPMPGAVSYRVEVLDAAGRAVVDSTLRDTSLVVLDSLARAGQPLVWSVTTILADGSTRGSVPSRIVAPPAR